MSSLRLVPAAQYLRVSTQQQQYSLKKSGRGEPIIRAEPWS